MNRRDFLRTGVLAGAAVGTGGCATFNLQPPPNAFSVADMKSFLANLDGAMKQVFSRPLPSVLRPGAPAAKDSATDAQSERLARQGLGALLLSGSFHDLSPEDQVHPGMQARIGQNAQLFDRAALGMNDHLKGLSPTERSDIARSLEEDPELGTRVVALLDGEAASAGVPQARRLKLRTIGLQACSRLRQSPSLVIDEYAAKVEKVAARPGDVEAFERQLATRMGQDAFLAHKEKLLGANQRWHGLLAQEGGGEELTPPPPPPPIEQQRRPLVSEDPTAWRDQPAEPRKQSETSDDQVSDYTAEERAGYRRSGNILLGVGSGLFGLGAVAGGIGLWVGLSSGAGWIGAAFIFTAAGLLVIGGIVCLIIGGVRRARGG